MRSPLVSTVAALTLVSSAGQDRLSLFNHRNDAEHLLTGATYEICLIALENLIEDERAHPATMSGRHQGNVDDDDMTPLKVPQNALEHAGV